MYKLDYTDEAKKGMELLKEINFGDSARTHGQGSVTMGTTPIRKRLTQDLLTTAR